MKKKLALLVAGEYRQFDEAVKTWKFLKELGNDVDVFFSTWRQSREINQKLNIDIYREIESHDILSKIPNAYINIENVIQFKSTTSGYIHHWRQAIKMMNSSEHQYDYLMLTRPDVAFYYEKPMTSILNQTLPDRMYGLGKVNIGPAPWHIYIQDMLFYGKFDYVKLALLGVPQFDITYKDLHYHLAKHFVYYDIYVDHDNLIHQIIVRPTMKDLLDRPLKDLYDIAAEWSYTKGLQ